MWQQIGRYQRGLSAIEFVISAPLLFLLLAGVLELGLALVQYMTLTKLVQEGARYAVTNVYGTSGSAPVADSTAIKCVVVTGTTADLSANCDSNATSKPLKTLTLDDVTVAVEGKYVTVTAVYHYTPLLNFGAVGTDFSFDFNAFAVMRTVQ